MDVPGAVERLRMIFPHQDGAGATRDDFGEKSQYRTERESRLSYAVEDDTLFGPMLKLYDLARRYWNGNHLRNRSHRITQTMPR